MRNVYHISGRDHSKTSELGLTPLPSRHIKSPGIAECPLIFECKVIHKNDIIPNELPEDIMREYFHRVYFGRILAASVDRRFLSGLE